MKIKQVCELTGLTPRAVRFYTEKGLLPQGEEKAYGRTLREYTADDVRTLQDVMTLRESGFTVQEILSMQQDPQAIAPLVTARIASLQKELENGTAALRCLNTGYPRTSWHSLAQSLRPTGASPLAKPDFSQLEDEEEGVLLQMADDPPTPRQKTLRICLIISAVILCLLTIGAIRAVVRYCEPVGTITVVSDVQFTSLQPNRATILCVGEHPSPIGDFFRREQSVRVDGIETGALFEDTTYCCVNLQIEMPRYEAEWRGLLDSQGIFRLENIEYYTQIAPYITLVDVHAG